MSLDLEELRGVATRLLQTLDRLKAAGYWNDALMQEARVLDMRLASAYARLGYGTGPVATVGIPPRLWFPPWREKVASVLAAIEARHPELGELVAKEAGQVGEYMPAAVCRRGHVLSSLVTSETEVSPRCPECGAEVLTKCPSCGGRIRGQYHVKGVIGVSGTYTPPIFCDLCGSPHPWASRSARIYQLENILDEQDLDEATRLAVRDQLEALRNPDLEDEEQQRRWERVKKLAPDLIQAGARIIESIATAAIQKRLGL